MATLLTNEVSYIQNCPRIADVHRFVYLLRELGCMVHWQKNGIRIQPGRENKLPCDKAEARWMRGEAITGMRSSLCLLGAMLGRCGYVTMEYPGGCVIGERPIDLHIKALEQMGVVFREEEGSDAFLEPCICTFPCSGMPPCIRIPFIQHHPHFYDNLILCRKALFRTMSSKYVFLQLF